MEETIAPPAASEATAPKSPRMTHIARLDPEGIYLGIDEIAVADLTDAHVHLPDGCDLPPGKYRWLPDMQAFWPIEETVRK